MNWFVSKTLIGKEFLESFLFYKAKWMQLNGKTLQVLKSSLNMGIKSEPNWKNRRYLTTNKAYGKSGHRDAHLQMSDVQIGGRQGTIHFIRFPTSQVSKSLYYSPDPTTNAETMNREFLHFLIDKIIVFQNKIEN